MRQSSIRILLAAAILAPTALAAVPGLGAWTPAPFPEYQWCDVTLRDFAFGTPSTGVAVGSCMTLLTTATGGATWVRVATIGDIGDLHAAHFFTPAQGIAVGVNAINQPSALVTLDGGATWAFRIFYLRDESGGGHEGSLRDARFVSPTDAVAVARVWNGDGAIARSSDGGATWRTTEWFDRALLGVDFAPDGDHGVAVGAFGAVHRTTDGGLTWTAGDSGTSLTLHDVDVLSATEAFAVGDSGVVLRTTDGGATWTRVQTGVTGDLFNVQFTLPTDAWASGEGGLVLRSADGGATWVPQPAPATADLHALGFSSPGTGYAGGKETLLRYVSLDAAPGLVADALEGVLPS